MKYQIMLLTFLIFTSCQTVTISDSAFKKASAPHYTDTKWFYLWGIFPNVETVSILDICQNRGLAQAQSLDTFGDSFIRIITLGIVYPKSVKVWCK